jgi:hypothetical protein
MSKRSHEAANPLQVDVMKRPRAEDAAAPPFPGSFKVTLEYGRVPLGRECRMRALLTAKPPEAVKSDSKYVALVLDESMSMGKSRDPKSGTALLRQMLLQLVEDGIPDVKNLYLRFLGFGTTVVDHQIEDAGSPLVLLGEETKPRFKQTIENIEGVMGGTDIGAGVYRGIGVLEEQLAQMPEEERPDAMHVIVLTDGGANVGDRDPKSVLRNAQHLVQGLKTNIFVHVVGLGPGADAKWIERALDDGNLGLSAQAPTAASLGTAFESVFCLALNASAGFNVAISGDADPRGARVKRLGMLAQERSELVHVTVARSDAEVTTAAVEVKLVGNPAWTAVAKADVTYFADPDDEGPQDRNPDVKKAVEVQIVQKEQEAILEGARSLHEQRRQLAQHAADVMARGYDEDALVRMQTTIDEQSQVADSAEWRSMEAYGGGASQSYATSRKCSAKYGRMITPARSR